MRWSPFVSTKIRSRYLRRNGIVRWSCYVPVRSRKWILAQLESQLSTDKYQLVVAQTNLDNYKLQLKQLLELDITEEIELVMPELTEKDILTPLPSKQTIYNTSLAVMPQIKSSELAVDIAELEKKKGERCFPSFALHERRAGYRPSFRNGLRFR